MRKASGEYQSVSTEEDHFDASQTRDPELVVNATITKTQNSSKESIRSAIQDYVDRITNLLQSKLRKVTLLTWSLWFTASAAYT